MFLQRDLILRESETLGVVDLPSINNNELRALVINSILTEEWENAEKKWEEAMLRVFVMKIERYLLS